jgi:hypothetical protein
MRLCFITFLVFFLLPFYAHTDIILVPADQPTIQAGISAAVDGDTVLVAPGTYFENINFLGKGITVMSSDGPELSVIDGNQTLHVARFINGEGYDSALVGFTITNGKAYIGGGIFCRYSSTPTLIGNIVARNTAQADGGGIACYEGGSARIFNNLITDNQASGYGGGIHCHYASPDVINNTIVDNSSTLGGGIYHCYYSEMEITNSIIWNNSASTGPDIWIGGPSPYPSSSLTISYSNVKGGISSVYVTSGSNINWGSGMIDADPLFVDAAIGDFHLTYNSPCRDTGDNSAIAGLYDFEGDPRIAWDGIVDMGADEFYNHLYVTGDKTPGGLVEGKFVGIPGTSPVGLFFGSGILEPSAPTQWGNFCLEAPWVLVSLVPIPSDGILVIPETIPLSPTAPYNHYLQALIGLDSYSLSNLEVLEVR